MRIIGYAYDADHHCESCMLSYAREVPFAEWVWPKDASEHDYADGGLWDLFALVEDEIIRDSEGNPIRPIFSIDEWYDIGYGNQTLTCGDCGAELDTYEEDDDPDYGEGDTDTEEDEAFRRRIDQDDEEDE